MQKVINRMDKPLLIITTIMFLFGLLMVFSASNVSASFQTGNPYTFFFKHCLILVICLLGSLFIMMTPLKRYRYLAPLALYGVIGALVFVFGYASIINNARRWLNLGFFHLQPSEFAKTIIIIYFAFYYHKYYRTKKLLEVLKPLFYAGLIILLTFLQPDLGTASIILGIVIITFLMLPINPYLKKQVIKIGGGLVFFLVLCLMFNGKPLLKAGQLNRFQFLNPCDRYRESTGYQVCNGFIAINNGGLLGVGLGNSTQKYLYLPAAHTDFIFPVIVEELGLIVGLIIIFIFFYIFLRLLRIGRSAHTLTNAIIVYGVAIYFILHVLINLVGVLGLFPLTGTPLPFLSYGGSYVLNLALAFALVQRVAIESNLNLKEKVLKRGKR